MSVDPDASELLWFPARVDLLVEELGNGRVVEADGDNFFAQSEDGAELAKLAHRKAYNDGVAKGLRGIELSAHVSRSAQALRAKDFIGGSP